jgi:DNA-binding transcriptional LysR family regulator
VSRRISELEKDLSVKLFDRKPDGFVLTEHGHRLFAIAERMESQVVSIGESVRAEPAEVSGRVRIASMEGIAAFYLAERFAAFNRRHPQIVIELVTERHLINLTKREADISVSFVPLAGPKLVVRKVGTFRLALFASSPYLQRRSTPGSRQDLEGHDFVDYVEDLVAIPIVHWLLDVLEPSTVVFRSTSMAAQQNAIAAGQGIGLLPLFSAKTNPKLVPVLADEVVVKRDVYLSVHEDIEFMGRMRAVTRFLSELFQREADYLNQF